MKKPIKYFNLKETYLHPNEVNAFYNGRMWGANMMWEEMEAYHQQEINIYKREYKLMCANINKLKQLLKENKK